MASDIWLRTILIVRKETRCRHIGYSYRLTARVLLYAPSHRQDNTYHGLCYTSRGALAGTRNSSTVPGKKLAINCGSCDPWKIANLSRDPRLSNNWKTNIKNNMCINRYFVLISYKTEWHTQHAVINQYYYQWENPSGLLIGIDKPNEVSVVSILN